MSSRKADRFDMEWLPAITCMAIFESSPLENGYDMSILEIIWQPDDYAMPISRQAMEYIKAVDWASQAFNFWH